MSGEGEMAAAFTADVAQVEGATVVSFAGELDISVAAEVRQTLSGVAGSTPVRVDLTPVTFLDSACIGLLVAACEKVRDANATFHVTCPDGIARRVLEVSGLFDYLQVEDPP